MQKEGVKHALILCLIIVGGHKIKKGCFQSLIFRLWRLRIRAVLKGRDFFLLRTALKDSP